MGQSLRQSPESSPPASFLSSFDLSATLECGQCFRWEALPGGDYRFAAGNRYGNAGPSSLSSLWQDAGWRAYFDLERDYDAIRRELSALDPTLAKAAAFAPGIRILNQDPWEALCCFILSQNNNIPRIKGIVERLCEGFGEPSEEGFGFPGPEKLASLSPQDLSPLRCGFRARYLIDAARRVARKEEGLFWRSCGQYLWRKPGSAYENCGCGLQGGGLHPPLWSPPAGGLPYGRLDETGHGDAVPRENTWLFRPLWGIAQQYIFHYSRNHPEEFR